MEINEIQWIPFHNLQALHVSEMGVTRSKLERVTPILQRFPMGFAASRRGSPAAHNVLHPLH